MPGPSDDKKGGKTGGKKEGADFDLFTSSPYESLQQPEPERAPAAARKEIIEVRNWEDLDKLRFAIMHQYREGEGRLPSVRLPKEMDQGLAGEIKEFLGKLKGRDLSDKIDILTERLNTIPGHLMPNRGDLNLRGVKRDELVVNEIYQGPRFQEVLAAVRDLMDYGVEHCPVVEIVDNTAQQDRLQDIIVRGILPHLRQENQSRDWIRVAFTQPGESFYSSGGRYW
jgi:hypothetical protein